MKIYSVEIGKSIRKGLTISLKERLKFISFDKKASKVCVSIFYPDIVYSSLALPKIEDEDTLQILIKSKMSAVLEEGKKYSFILQKKEDISENESLFDIYGIPVDKFYETLTVLEEDTDSIELFTVDIFSLIPISHKICGDKTCFHFYADTEKVLITVSKGEEILYVRSIPLPDFIEPSDLTNIYYENFNMTYMFAIQNRRINVESIVISGSSASNQEFLKLCRELTNLDLHIPSADSFITGISQNDFMDFIIPVGTALLKQNYDFSPITVKKEKNFKKVSKILSSLSIFFLLMLTAGIFTVYADISEKENRFLSLKNNIQEKIRLINNKITKNEMKYYTDYIKHIEKSEDLNPIFVFDQMPSLFELLDEKKIIIENSDEKQVIQIFSEHQFTSLSELLNFKLKLNEVLRNYRNIHKNIQENKEKLSLKIDLRIERDSSEIK
ncbi:hypothetical protein [Persephonella sp.]|uniref:hypothetical protein n=1 Tax=Persephonella sp. TaxID=2060922 RepID=UPI0025F4C779|nr:hypothetical protein [Persephonella sp.]